MQRVYKLLFCVVFLVLCWYAMLAAHELGHVVGALVTGGQVKQVVLHPLAISRTEVSPNPRPGVVVWMGPILGCLVPFLIYAFSPGRMLWLRKLLQFFVGFCFIANGAYIALGSFEAVGDCGQMLQTGTPLWTLLVFGLVTSCTGLFLWHRLGSVKQFAKQSEIVTLRLMGGAFLLLIVFILVGLWIG